MAEHHPVFLVPAHAGESADVLARKIGLLWEKAGLDGCFRRNDLAALKLHVGEPGKSTYVSPDIAAALVRRMEDAGARPFLTDSAVLYKSPRNNGPGHTMVAAAHGFTTDRVGAPFLPADGLDGSDEHELPVEGKHFQSVSIAAAIVQARSMIVLSHATGHLGTGFGGALKNVGMGCGSKKAKMRQHFGQQPSIDEELCSGCGECAEWCPENAITVEGTAAIDKELCIGCGACIARCLDDAVSFDWTISGRELQERIVEHAAAVAFSKAGRIGYVTVAMNITKDCDCLDKVQEPLCEDIGILASFDPVAIDDAALRLFRGRTGKTLESLSYPNHDGTIQIDYAERLGLGHKDADIITVDA